MESLDLAIAFLFLERFPLFPHQLLVPEGSIIHSRFMDLQSNF